MAYHTMVALMRKTIPFPPETLYVYVDSTREECERSVATRGREGESSSDAQAATTKELKRAFLEYNATDGQSKPLLIESSTGPG